MVYNAQQPAINPATTPSSDSEVADAGSRTKVAVIGGGIGGLTAAHELNKRGFAVTVFEAKHESEPGQPNTAFGGKARSWWGDLHGVHPDLPAEHGFRFFPGFYKHVIDTMSEIPAADGNGFVAGRLKDLDVAVLALDGGARLVFPLPTTSHKPSWLERACATFRFWRELPHIWECACAVGALARLATSCQRRWDVQLENQSWLDYVSPSSGERRSQQFDTLFGVGLTRAFVATRAEEMSARTGGTILLQLIYDMFDLSNRDPADRVLDGPTSDVWIDPWYEYLDHQGVIFKPDHTLQRIELDEHGAIVRRGFRQRDEPDPTSAEPSVWAGDFDCYVLAVPCEKLMELLAANPALAERSRQLARVFNLETAWMNGLVIGCDVGPEPTLPRGHIMCLESPWALTMIDQKQVWSDPYRSRVPYDALFSVDISNWDSPGLGGISAIWMQPPREEIAAEVWRQLRAHLPELPAQLCGAHVLDSAVRWKGDPSYVISMRMRRGQPGWFGGEPIRLETDHEIHEHSLPFAGGPHEQALIVSPQLGIPAGGPTPSIEAVQRTNAEPLLINTPGSWRNRPGPVVEEISNLFLAADYVRTTTDFASMEAANEAAKHAVNAILQGRYDGPHGDCPLHDLEQPDVSWFKKPQDLARQLDETMFKLRLRAPFRLPIIAWTLLWLVARLRSLANRVHGQARE